MQLLIDFYIPATKYAKALQIDCFLIKISFLQNMDFR